MWRMILAGCLGLVLLLGSLRAQNPAAPGATTGPLAASANSTSSTPTEGPATPPLPYVFAFLITVLVLVIVCMPTRKA